MIKACIFDLDGVIVDTAKYHYMAWKKLADLLEIPFDEEENEKMKGISRRASLDRLLELGNLSIAEGEKEKYCHTKNIWYLDYVSQMNKDEILPGVNNFILDLKKANVAVALGSASKNARHILDLTNLTESFDVIVDGNDVIKSKPDPEVFLKGAKLMAIDIENTVVFEDSAKGIDAAIAGGFKTVGIGSADHLGHADLVIQTFEGVSLEQLNDRLN